ncbi:hypothetical protein ACQCVO_20355 [Bacillus infantis]
MLVFFPACFYTFLSRHRNCMFH